MIHFLFELKKQSRYCRHLKTCREDMSRHVFKCRVISTPDPLADTTMSCVGNMTKDMSPTRHAMSANEGLGRHDRLRHSLLGPWEVKGGRGEQFELLLVIIDDLVRVHPTWSGFELS